ncbi:hypothetical protein GCM10010182_29630 [Actinomadura cremea]|nr:hypothetical protein GCM10010182_29630 [Actinomadura cremea]
MRTDMRPADALLAEIEPLAHADRRRRVADLRHRAGDRALVPLLVDLGTRGPYERELALALAAAARDEASREHIAIVARTEGIGPARAAARLAVRFGTGADELLDILAEVSAPVRKAAWSAVRRHRRRDGLADALVDRVAERWGDGEAASLLPACRRETVAARLGTLAHAVPSWKTLGRAHPGLVLDHAERASGAMPPGDARNELLRDLAPGIAVAAHHSPGQVVTLLERAPHLLPAAGPPRRRRERPAPRGALPVRRTVGMLLDAEPRRMLAFLLGAHRPALWLLLVTAHGRSVRRRLARFGDDDLAEIARAVHEHAGNAVEPALRGLLRAVAPSRRERLFAVLRADAEARGRLTSLRGLPDLLPRPVRTRHARSLVPSPRALERDLPLYAHLPYEEARPLLEGMTRDPDAYQRANGAALLVRCAERSGDAATLLRALETLDRVDARESIDTVVYALVKIPNAVLRADHTTLIERFAHRVLDAHDAGARNGAAHVLTPLATEFCRAGLARQDPGPLAAALGLIDRGAGIAQHRLPRDRHLDRFLPRGGERLLGDALAPYLAADATRGRHRLALLFAAALHRRAEDVPALRDALAHAVDTADGPVRRRAIELWLAPPRTRADRVGHVVTRHPSAIAVPAVLRAIATERTDLLDLVLTDDLDPRRIDPAWTRRWTARQRTFLSLLGRRAKSG